MRDASLDEFLDTGEGTDATATGKETDATATDERAGADTGPDGERTDVTDDPVEDHDEDGEKDAEPDPDPVEPAVSTYDWKPTGAECDACGAVVERRWRDDAGLVCPDCKAW